MSEFSIAAVFSDNMVIQRNKNINVFGYGTDGAEVTVVFCGNKSSSVIKDGKWNVVLPPVSKGEKLEMTVVCGSYKKTFVNIIMGEVWLAGGQSNMELELRNCTGGKKHLSEDKNVNVRYYYTMKNCFFDENFFEEEKRTAWMEFSEETAGLWSAVAYFYAKKLSEDLGVTVGIIGCNWGGTSASYWMNRETLEKDIEMKAYLDDYDNAVAGKTNEQMDAEYDEYVRYAAEFDRKTVEFYAKNPDGTWDECQEYAGKCLYPGPYSRKNPFHATALYDTMLMRVCPYTIKGFIFYQGETDDNRPNTYYKLFRAMIQLWRDNWGDDELPFLFVQLPMHQYKQDPDYKHWCLIREAQDKIARTVKNTAMAVILDCGEFNEIHPKNKVPVGERLELLAMNTVYGDTCINAFAPSFRDFRYKGNAIELLFSHAQEGFKIKGELCGFEVAGADGEFKTADAVISGSTVTVSSKEVEKPLYARYCWTNYGPVSVFGKNGIPLAPFRTHKI